MHIRNRVIAAVLLLFSFINLSCQYGLSEVLYRRDPVTVRASSLIDLTEATGLKVKSETYTVAVITDVHFGAASEGDRTVDVRFKKWLASCSSAGTLPAFVICLGDVAEHGSENEMKRYKSFCNEIETTYAAQNLKVYTVLGNHDLYNSGWYYWKQYVYPYTSFYYFQTSSFSWYFLDSGSGSLGPNQRLLLKQKMESSGEAGRPKVVCMHYPLYAGGNFYYCLQDTTERNLLISQFAEDNVKLVLVGHTHKHIETDFGAYLEENVPGFNESGQWAVFAVDEKSGTVSAVKIKSE